MSTAHADDWTKGPARTAAAVVLGSLSLAGLAWTLARPHAAPTLGPAPPPASADTAGVSERSDDATPTLTLPAGTININTAGAAELESLPGIGPALAQRILTDRAAKGPFRTVNDLDRVPGIGPRILERLRPLVRVE